MVSDTFKVTAIVVLTALWSLLGCSKKGGDQDEANASSSNLKPARTSGANDEECTGLRQASEDSTGAGTKARKGMELNSYSDDAAEENDDDTEHYSSDDELQEGDGDCATAERDEEEVLKPVKPALPKPAPLSLPLPQPLATVTSLATSTNVMTATQTSQGTVPTTSMSTSTQTGTSTSTDSAQAWNTGPGLEACAAQGLAWRAVVNGGPGQCSAETLVKWCCSKENVLVRFPGSAESLANKFREYDGLGLKLYHCSAGSEKTTFHFGRFKDGSMLYKTLYIATPPRDTLEPDQCPKVSSELLGIPKELLKPAAATFNLRSSEDNQQ